MQRILSVLVLGGGLAFLAGEYAPTPADREEQVAAMTRIVARATILEPETVPAEQPDLRRPIASPAAQRTALLAPVPAAPPTAEQSAITTSPVSAAAPSTVAPDLSPSVDIHRRLAREIQSELKRVGCYTGRIDGSWGSRSRSAMTTFMAEVNAQLPTTEPDVFLLSLIKGQRSTVCGLVCARTEVLSGGRCVARTVVADAAKQDTPARSSGNAPTRPAAVAAINAEPLPGRMSIGGPVPSANTPQASVATDAPREVLPWQANPTESQTRKQRLAALPADDDAGPIVAAPPVPRKVTKVKRASAAPPRPKPVKRRYGTNRSVQMLFLHPLGRM